ncbi:MAG: chromosomal replication initiator protein DnaA [Candidatus Vogelbacteria bacterium]|nr:chromosomal replication initiator protein DnaA [Candidatus Vogelbacteria bacterium]
MVDNKKLWDTALAEIELTISKASFGTWFKNTFISKQDQGTIYLSVPNTFVRDWLLNKYHKAIMKALRDTASEVRALEYVISKIEDRNKQPAGENTPKIPIMGELGLSELYINKESNLNPKYTFESFIVGPFNEVAYAAAQAVVKNPGMNYNPLYIYGGTGLGKTHLIQAIGNHIKRNFENKKVFYLTSETFTNDYVNSVLNNRVPQFKDKYRKYDVLIMDDIQFFSNKDKSQEELFHLFNTFHENNKQIVFSSDKSPKYIQNLEERLRSRFEGGMIVDVARPDYESRLAILRSKVKNGNLPVNDEIIEYLASIVQDSIRELEGALNTVLCQIQAKNRTLTLTEVRSLIKNSIKPQRNVSVKDVISVISNFYNIDEKILYEKSRRKEIVKPRQIIMYILREDFNTSYPYIGQKLGGRDHTTVIHACEKIKNDIKNNSILNQEIDQIRLMLYNT